MPQAAPRAVPAGELHRRLAAAFLGSLALHAAAAAVLDVSGSGKRQRDAAGPFVLHASLHGDRSAQSPAPAAAGTAQPRAQAQPASVARAPVEAAQPPAHPLAAVAQTHYYKRSELQVLPGIKTHIMPEYPLAALGSGLTGTVTLRLFLDDKGRVEQVQTLSAEPPGHFEASAERAFRAALFTPGYRAGKPVPAQIVVEVLFEEAPAGAK